MDSLVNLRNLNNYGFHIGKPRCRLNRKFHFVQFAPKAGSRRANFRMTCKVKFSHDKRLRSNVTWVPWGVYPM